jgi:hypothetical protein
MTKKTKPDPLPNNGTIRVYYGEPETVIEYSLVSIHYRLNEVTAVLFLAFHFQIHFIGNWCSNVHSQRTSKVECTVAQPDVGIYADSSAC